MLGRFATGIFAPRAAVSHLRRSAIKHSMKRFSNSAKYISVSVGITIASLLLSSVACFCILLMFAFWWESVGSQSIFYKHNLLLRIPLLFLILTCVAATAFRRFKRYSFSLVDLLIFSAAPAFAVFIYLLFSGAFGTPPHWL